MEQKKNYTTEDNIRSTFFAVRELLEETKKIREVLQQISSVLPQKEDDKNDLPF
ncbi:MAG: hypothetical protein ACLFUW_00365 [Bacteroidales bacterium]